MGKDGPERFLSDAELEARADFHTAELDRLLDELARRDAARQPLPFQGKRRHLSIVDTGKAVLVGAGLWFLSQIREHPVRSASALAGLVAIGLALLIVPRVVGPAPVPNLGGRLPPATASPSPTMTSTPTPTPAPSVTPSPTAPGGAGDVAPNGEDAPDVEPTDPAPTAPPPAPGEPNPPPDPEPTGEPTVRPTPEPTPEPTPTVDPPDPPDPPDDDGPLLEICLRLPPILRELCLGLL